MCVSDENGAGMIAGIVIGVVALVVIAALVAWYLRKKKRKFCGYWMEF